jgi:hypothetical protein
MSSIQYNHFLFRCIRHLLKFGANSSLENNLGLTPWNYLSKLNETIELECLQLFVDISQTLVNQLIWIQLKILFPIF